MRCGNGYGPRPPPLSAQSLGTTPMLSAPMVGTDLPKTTRRIERTRFSNSSAARAPGPDPIASGGLTANAVKSNSEDFNRNAPPRPMQPLVRRPNAHNMLLLEAAIQKIIPSSFPSDLLVRAPGLSHQTVPKYFPPASTCRSSGCLTLASAAILSAPPSRLTHWKCS